eukprot:scaffold271953_cov16-Tisochrysis_lutea.AAC.1
MYPMTQQAGSIGAKWEFEWLWKLARGQTRNEAELIPTSYPEPAALVTQESVLQFVRQKGGMLQAVKSTLDSNQHAFRKDPT